MNTVKTFSDINHTNVFLGQSPNGKERKTKINQQDLIKLTRFCTAKETKKKTKRQLTEWEKILSNDASNKGLISKIYEQLIQLNSKKAKRQIREWEKIVSNYATDKGLISKIYKQFIQLNGKKSQQPN